MEDGYMFSIKRLPWTMPFIRQMLRRSKNLGVLTLCVPITTSLNIASRVYLVLYVLSGKILFLM